MCPDTALFTLCDLGSVVTSSVSPAGLARGEETYWDAQPPRKWETDQDLGRNQFFILAWGEEEW